VFLSVTHLPVKADPASSYATSGIDLRVIIVRQLPPRCGNTFAEVMYTSLKMSIFSLSVSTVIHNSSRLGGVVVSVLVMRPKGRGFRPDRGDGFLRAVKTRSTVSFGWEVKTEVPCRKILRHVKDPLTYLRYITGKILTPSIPPTRCPISLLISPESSGKRVRSFPQLLSSSPWLSTLTNHPGD
jgi:hypothetical protein